MQADTIINEQALTIDALSRQNDRLSKSLDYATAEAAKESAWYRDPKLIAPSSFLIGLLAGAYLMKQSR